MTMSTAEKVSDKAGALRIGAVALALGDPSGGILTGTALTGLAAIAYGRRASCAVQTRQSIRRKTLTALRQSPDFADLNMDRLDALLETAVDTEQLGRG
ncbi:MAG: hypothetical protein AAFR57_08385 [Pseudomonadota bacterium]